MRPEITTQELELKIIMRSDTYSRWNEHNPILREGEIACVVLGRKSKLYKLGDGVTEFKKLKYVKLEEALESGYIFGTYQLPTKLCKYAVCLDTAPDYVYDRLTEQDLILGDKI